MRKLALDLAHDLEVREAQIVSLQIELVIAKEAAGKGKATKEPDSGSFGFVAAAALAALGEYADD